MHLWQKLQHYAGVCSRSQSALQNWSSSVTLHEGCEWAVQTQITLESGLWLGTPEHHRGGYVIGVSILLENIRFSSWNDNNSLRYSSPLTRPFFDDKVLNRLIWIKSLNQIIRLGFLEPLIRCFTVLKKDKNKLLVAAVKNTLGETNSLKAKSSLKKVKIIWSFTNREHGGNSKKAKMTKIEGKKAYREKLRMRNKLFNYISA